MRIIIDGTTMADFDVAVVVDWFCENKVRRPNQKQRKAYVKRAPKNIRLRDDEDFVRAFFDASVQSESESDSDWQFAVAVKKKLWNYKTYNMYANVYENIFKCK